MEDNKKKFNKKNILDWVVAGVILIGLIICCIFRGCKMDIIVAIICAVLVACGSFLLYKQNKKLAEKENLE